MDEGLLSLKWNNHRSSFLHVLSSLRNKESYADVTLACDGKFYPSHKLVLSTCSEYFQEMFQLTTCKHPIIILKDIPKEDLEALLNYMYLGEVNVLQERLTTLIKSAECLKIKGLAVPDDTPEKPTRHKREAEKSESRLDSKRRCTESDHRKKGNSREFSSKSSGDVKYSDAPARIPSAYSPQDSGVAINSCPDSNLESGVTSNEERVFIKQESPEFICLPEEDSKEAVRQSLNLPFSSPHHEDDSSSKDGTDSSKVEDHWTVDDVSYPEYDPGDEGNYENNEPSSSNQSDMVWGSSSEPLSLQSDSEKGWTDQSISFPQGKPMSGISAESSHFSQSVNICTYCSHRTIAKADLLKHMRIHTGEKPFRCKWCPYSSTQSSNLNKHYRRIHLRNQLDDSSSKENS